MNRRSFLTIMLTGITLLIGQAGAAQQNRKPNLLYVFPDQMRMHAMGFWKKPGFNKLLRTDTDPVYTPNIDRLAAEGVVFTQATSTHPVCSPHRAMLMSGMYPSRNGVEDLNCKRDRQQGLRHHIQCFTDVLSQAGYETAYVGKVHWERTEALFDQQFNFVGTTEPPGGHYANNYDTYVPPGRGRHSIRFWFQQFKDSHFNALTYSNRPELVNGNRDGRPYRPQRFSTEVEADVIVQFLENKRGERGPGKPFSIFWAPNPPHNPYSSLKDCERDIHDKYYRDMPLEQQVYRKNIRPLASGQTRNDPRRCTPIYYSLVTGVDRQLGRVLEALKKTGEADNTIVVFTSDHGEMLGSHGVMGKNYYEDESFLIPFVLRYPDKIKPHADDLLLGTVDIMPSLLGLMGLADRIPESVEGLNYAQGIATGDYSTCPKPESALYLNIARKGVRTDRYTYVVHDDGRAEVVDNIKDPYQLKKLSPSAIPPAELAMLKQELGQRLVLAGDKWASERRFTQAITYPRESTRQDKVYIPKQANEFVWIYKPAGDSFFGPDTKHLKEGQWYDEWVPNDHAFVKADDGKWHVFGITHPLVMSDPLKDGIHEGEYASFHAVSSATSFKETLKKHHYSDLPKILPPQERPGEPLANHAPYIVKKDGLYHMVYGHSPIRLAVSSDLSNWQPKGNLFSEPDGARDPSLLLHEGRYHMVYCSVKCVRLRTSKDLIHWSEPETIFRSKTFDPESPSLLFYQNSFYLFVCSWDGIWDQKDIQGAYQHKTYVLHSEDPLRFGVDDEKQIATLKSHAPEIFQDEEGQWNISSVEWPNRGVSVDKLEWVEKR